MTASPKGLSQDWGCETKRQIEALDAELLALHKADPVSRLLAEVPGVGPITAITLALSVAPEHFASGRHFAAWLALTPKEHSTGGKPRLGRISKAGNERLRSLLVVGATAVIRHAKPGKPSASAWLLGSYGAQVHGRPISGQIFERNANWLAQASVA